MIVTGSLLLVGATITGCASDQAHRYYLDHKLAPKSVDQVEILWAPPTRPYILVADYQARGESAFDMRERAASHGADAVIVTQIGGDVFRSKEYPDPDRSQRFSRITGSAIVYK